MTGPLAHSEKVVARQSNTPVADNALCSIISLLPRFTATAAAAAVTAYIICTLFTLLFALLGGARSWLGDCIGSRGCDLATRACVFGRVPLAAILAPPGALIFGLSACTGVVDVPESSPATERRFSVDLRPGIAVFAQLGRRVSQLGRKKSKKFFYPVDQV